MTRAFLAVTARGFLAAAQDPLSALQAYEQVTPYFPSELLAQSLQRIAPTWLHQGRWGEQRQSLLEPYSQWLHEHQVLSDANAWQGATTNAYLPEAV